MFCLHLRVQSCRPRCLALHMWHYSVLLNLLFCTAKILQPPSQRELLQPLAAPSTGKETSLGQGDVCDLLMAARAGIIVASGASHTCSTSTVAETGQVQGI